MDINELSTETHPLLKDFNDQQGSIKSFLNDINAIAMQLDNSDILMKAKCRFMGGHFENGLFIKDEDKQPKINEAGWTIIEHFIDKNTCPNEVLSNKTTHEISIGCFVEGMSLLADLTKHHKEYGLKIEDIDFIVIESVSMAFSGQKRALSGETAKALNKVIRQIEQVVEQKNQKPKGILGGFGK